MVYKYHEHDTLLEKSSEQDLSEEEKADAWAAYENDVSMKSKFSLLSFFLLRIKFFNLFLFYLLSDQHNVSKHQFCIAFNIKLIV